MFFFSPVKKKSARESHFWPFCRFFHGQFFFFTGTFLPFFTIFHAQLVFFHGQFYGFVRFFHGQKIVFTGKNFIFFTGNFCFSRATFVLWKRGRTSHHSGFSACEKKVTWIQLRKFSCLESRFWCFFVQLLWTERIFKTRNFWPISKNSRKSFKGKWIFFSVRNNTHIKPFVKSVIILQYPEITLHLKPYTCRDTSCYTQKGRTHKPQILTQHEWHGTKRPTQCGKLCM